MMENINVLREEKAFLYKQLDEKQMKIDAMDIKDEGAETYGERS